MLFLNVQVSRLIFPFYFRCRRVSKGHALYSIYDRYTRLGVSVFYGMISVKRIGI